MQQMSLPGMIVPPSPVPRHRLFFAVLLPKDAGMQALQLAHRLRHRHELSCVPLNFARLHVSLLGLGDHIEFPTRIARLARSRTDYQQFRSFLASFDCVSSLNGKSRKPRRCAIALRDSCSNYGFAELQREIARSLEIEWPPAFTPHVTLMYEKHQIAEESIEPVRWEVTELALVHSRINRGRLQPYSVIDRWPLR